MRKLWNKGPLGKAIVGVIGLVVLCCAWGAITGRRPQQTASAPTGVPVATAIEAPTEAPEPTVEDPPTPEPTEVPEPTATQAPTAAPTPEPQPGFVSREMLGDDWPLTVESGQLMCIDQAVVLATGGMIYAVNGTAKGRADDHGWQDIEPIWADDPAVQGLKISLQPLLTQGLALCS